MTPSHLCCRATNLCDSGGTCRSPHLAFCEHGRLVLLEEATHWVNEDEPERVNELLLEFLGASAATTQRHGQH